MKKHDKTKEPFDPKRTPEPPQVQDPSARIKEEDIETGEKGKQQKGGDEKKPSKLLGESEPDIHDETTI